MKVKNKRANPVAVDPRNGDEPFNVDGGGVVEVSDDVGRSLLEQPDRWELAGSTGKPKKSESNTNSEES